jgi:Fe2+ or Zn2+ uptake regulation protein
MSAEALDAELSEALRAAGHRVTLPRLLVHRHLRRGDRHLTAEQLHSELAPQHPSLSPATVYATLDLLEDLGLVRRVNTAGGSTIYDTRTRSHHHVVCRHCGRIEDIDAAIDAEPARRAAAATGFTIDHAELQLTGLCRACQAR